ncbi:MAG: carboxypeptidase-like regulatory domain-containing protein [Candidatus Bathyarchaeota archaeon]|nr:carboxypeptidase-like regulatory domain-containing protein [Candidatus Bathyarchaeota archaeon]
MSIILILLLFLPFVTLDFAYDTSRTYGYIGGGLVVTTSMNIEYDEAGNALITIAGRVIDESNKTVPKASMSIQVADPLGSTAHIALVYSKSDGTFLNEFVMKGDYLPGNYTIYLTATKVGYIDANLELPFSILILDFSISVIPDIQAIEQGVTANYSIFLIRTKGTNFPISLDIQGTPSNASAFFKDVLTTEPNSTLYMETFEDTPIGTYNLTISGEGNGINHSTLAFLQIIEGEEMNFPEYFFIYRDFDLFWILIIILLVIVIFVLLVYFKKIDKSYLKKIEKIIEPIKDKEYLATARALAKLEEMKAKNEIDEETYLKLKKEYEKKLKG